MNAITTAVVACAAFSSIAHGAEAVRPVPATYIMVCCHGADKGTKFLANGEWDDRHDYRDYAFALDQMRKIKEAGINVVGVDFTNPSQWDQFKAHHWPMLLNVVKAAKELDMQYFLFLGNTCAHTMKYWNEKAKVVWEEFAQDPHYRRYGFGDDRPMMTIFLPGKDFAAHMKRSRPEEKNWLEKFRIGTCQVNDPIVPTPTDGWGYRNKSAGSTDLARFVAPNSGVGPGTWARVDANEWRARVKWALGAKEYAVIGTYDDTCDCIFWGIADVRGSRNPTHVHKATKDDPYVYYNIVKEEVAKDDAARFKAAWESRRGEPYVEVPVSPPVFHGHPRFAQKYSRAIIHFALRAFHNAETNEYALANRKIAENCRFYIENKDVRNDRDSFYWNVGELCRIVLHYGSKGDVAPGLLSPEAEAAFLEMAFGYCHDMSRLSDAAADGMKTWRVYESENHHVQRDSALWQLMHALLKVDPAYGARKLAHGGTLREHYDAWEEFFCAWMRERAKRSMFIEVQSRVYGIHTIKNVYPLYDFSERSETRRIAKNFIDLFWALWAQEQIDGSSGGGMSRVYPSAAVKTASEASAWAYWYFGLNPSLAHKPDGMDYVCLDSAYRPHPLIGRIAADAKARGVYEIEMRPLGWTLPSDKYPNYRPDPEWGRIYRYTYATPDFIAGTQMFPQAPGDKWCKISSQNRFHGVVFGPRDAEILPIPAVTGRHAKTVKLPSVGYNAFWSMQRKGTLLTRKNRYANQTGGMRVFFSAAGGVDKVERDGEWWFTKCGGAYSAVRVACGEARLVGAGAGAEIPFDAKGKFLVCADPWAPVIMETARACDVKDEAAFRAKVKATALSVTPSALDYTGIYGNRFHMLLDRDDGSTIDGEPYVRKIDWSVKSPFVRMSWCGDAAELTFGGSTVRLDFTSAQGHHVSAVGGYDFVSAPEAPFKMPDVPVWRVPAREFPITDYGAVTGAVKNTEAFAKAIAACSAAGGGRVVVPAGDWRTGAIHLKSNVAIDLREGSRIVFTDDPADYLPAVHTNWEGVEAMSYSPLIFAYCCTNIAIVGKGRIAPETNLWRKEWDNRNTPMHKAFIATLYDWCSMGIPLEKRDITRVTGSHARPHLIQINRSANILLEDFLIRGSPFWNVHLFHSENVVVRGIDIYSHGHNTDGIDIDMTKNVVVENCIFDQGDDAIVLKAARNHDAWRLGRCTENVVVRNCTVRNGHVLMGAGSDVSGGIRNVFMHDCKMVGNVLNVFYVKTNERRGGFVENIYMKDCTVEMRGKSAPLSVVGIETDVLYEWRNLPTWDVRVTRIRNICAENVRATRAKHLLMVYGDARDPVDGVTLKNVTCGETTAERLVVVNAKNVTMDGKPLPSRPGKAPAR